MVYLLALVAVSVLAYLALCAFYYVLQERFIFIRFRVTPQYRFRLPIPFEEWTLDRGPGVSLHALYFPVERPNGVVLYFHGNTGSLRRWGKQAARFTRSGHAVLMPDPRGYGKSTGPLSEQALHADAQAWYERLGQVFPEQQVVVYGRSLGSGLATPVAANNRPRMLILETPFANLYDVAYSYLRILPYRLLLRYPFRNDRAIRRVKCPVYIFHGKRDTVVHYHSALKLYSLVPASVEREMFTFPKGHHSDLPRFVRFNRTVQRLLGTDAVGSG
jgi:uncharacterized protein